MPFEKKEIKKALSQEEYERRIAELQQELEELKKVKVEEPKKKGIYIPKAFESYYFVDEWGSVEQGYYDNFYHNDFRIVFGNHYKTKEEAEYQANVQKYTNLFRKYVEEHSKPLDWSDIGQSKSFILWDFYDNTLAFSAHSKMKHQGVIYASSTEILEDAIEFVGKENVIKYVLGVDCD